MIKRDCDDCHYRELGPAEEPCKSCNATDEGFTNWKKQEHSHMTNADRIRLMSDEELAKWLYNFFWRSKKYIHLSCILGWLQQPAEDSEDG